MLPAAHARRPPAPSVAAAGGVAAARSNCPNGCRCSLSCCFTTSHAPPASAGIIGRLEHADSVSHDGWTEVMAVNLEGS